MPGYVLGLKLSLIPKIRPSPITIVKLPTDMKIVFKSTIVDKLMSRVEPKMVAITASPAC